MVTFHHWGNVGDIVYSLPSIVALAGQEKAILLLEVDHPARYPPNMTHPLGNVTLTREYADKLIPLLKAQTYIADVRIWNGEKADYNLNYFRHSGFNHLGGDIAKYYRHVFMCQPETWKPWLTVEPDPVYADYVLVNRTQRYHNPNLSYAFLKRWEPRIMFMGLPSEYQEFKLTFGLHVPFLLPNDFLDAARAIAGSRLFIGNQSVCFAIAEGLKVRRIVEACPLVPNVIPNGANGWDVIRQDMFERIVEHLIF